MLDSNKIRALVWFGGVCISALAFIIDCKQTIDESKRSAELSKMELERYRKNFNKTNDLMLDLMISDLIFNPKEKEKVEVKATKEEKQIVNASKRSKEISIDKVHEIMKMYGITMEDFKRDFPEAIIVE